MNKPLKVIKIGNSAGVVLPKKLLAELGAEIGGTLSVVPTPRGIELIVKRDQNDEQLAAAREVMARRRRALAVLADAIMDEDREILAALAKS
jgi:putative addiction module antidote